MKKIKITTKTKKLLADMVTPVGLYLNLRDKFSKSILLESSDYHANDNNFSFICLEPMVTFSVDNHIVSIKGMDLDSKQKISKENPVIKSLQNLINTFNVDKTEFVNGFFGYTNYDAVQYFEKITIDSDKDKKHKTPNMHYAFFKYIIQIDHFKNEMILLENSLSDEDSKLDNLVNLVQNTSYPSYHFSLNGKENTSITDKEFKEYVKKGKEHCQKGDVFQMVLSRQFSQKFKGDDFNVYRALRAVNPSPYLFYFDFGNFKLFGSSPEAQLKASNGKAIINPIAGTFKRTGNDIEDTILAEKLAKDPKENAEHTMLVDLARNDLSRHGKKVTVKVYKQTQFYSHVIHLVSEVEANLKNPNDALQVFADTFPAGTLSGAPKYRAMQLIEKYEKQQRGFYGGAIGYFGFDKSVNHAITIRSFLSKNNTLFFQAGAGIVVSSDEENELQEVNNKLGALKKALKIAETI